MLIYNSETHLYEGESITVDGEVFNKACEKLEEKLQGEGMSVMESYNDAKYFLEDESNWTVDMNGVKVL